MTENSDLTEQTAFEQHEPDEDYQLAGRGLPDEEMTDEEKAERERLAFEALPVAMREEIRRLRAENVALLAAQNETESE
jgi:hypothetical protein